MLQEHNPFTVRLRVLTQEEMQAEYMSHRLPKKVQEVAQAPVSQNSNDAVDATDNSGNENPMAGLLNSGASSQDHENRNPIA